MYFEAHPANQEKASKRDMTGFGFMRDGVVAIPLAVVTHCAKLTRKHLKLVFDHGIVAGNIKRES